MEIRLAVPADVDALVEFNQAMALETEGKRLNAETLRAGVTAVFGDDRKGFYVVVEDKGFSVAVHYRQARQRNSTRRAVLSAARSLKNVRLVGGKLVVNFLVPDAPHKGLALERERSHFACDTVIFLGDDETDEDVFQIDRPGQLLSIRVGRKRTSAAPYYIRNQAEVDRVLETLIAVRGGHRD